MIDIASQQFDDGLHFLASNTSDICAIVDQKGKFCFLNSAANDYLNTGLNPDFNLESIQNIVNLDQAKFSIGRIIIETKNNKSVKRTIAVTNLRTRKKIPVEVHVTKMEKNGDYYYLLLGKLEENNILTAEYRKQKDLLLQKAEKFNAAQKAANIGTWHLDILTKDLSFSDQLYDIFDIPVTSVPKIKELFKKVHPDFRKVLRIHRKIFQTKYSEWNIDFKINRSSNEEAWIRFIGKFDLDADGVVTSARGTCQDVTRFKKLELEIEDVNNLSDSVQRIALIGGWERNYKTGELRWTKESCRIYGIDEKEGINLEKVLSCYPQSERVRLYELFEKITKQKVRDKGHFQINTPSGKIKYIELVGNPILDDQNNVAKVIGTIQDVTESRKIKNRLKATSNELNGFFNISLDLLCIADRKGYLKKINPRFIQSLGFSESELTEKRFDFYIHPSDRLPSFQMFKKVLNGEPITNFENRILGKNGEYRIYNWSAKLDSESGSIYAAGRDIHDNRVYESELQSYSEAISEHASIAKFNKDGIITDVNDKFCTSADVERSSVIGQTMQWIDSESNAPVYSKTQWSQILQGQMWHGEISTQSKSGQQQWLDMTISPVLNSDGEILQFLCFRYDITHKKKVEIELCEQKKQLNRIIDNSPGMVFQCNLYESNQPSFNYISKQGYEIFGISELEIIENPSVIMEMIHPADKSNLALEILESSNDLGLLNWQGRIITKSGKTKWVNARGVPQKMEDGSTQWIGILIDIDEQYKMQEELIKQRQVSEHQARLASIGELAAGVGHEINNPLTIVTSYSHLLRRQLVTGAKSTAETMEIIDKIASASSRIANIVKGLRTFSRADDCTATVFNIVEAVRDATFMVKDIYNKDQIEIEFESNQSLEYMIMGTHSQIEQVVLNLLSNAKDATEGLAKRKIWIRIDKLVDSISLTIRDNGRGIPEKIRQRIFDPFFTTKEVNKGTGLGLSLVHSIVNDHGGVLSIESQENEGTKVTATFPIARDIKDASLQNLARSSTPSVNYTGYSVMILDDEPDICELLEELFADMGFSTKSYSDGRIALKEIIAGQIEYDLIVSDIKMPYMDGPTFLKNLRNNNSCMNSKFAFITGGINLNLDAPTDEYTEHFDGYILKPFNEEAIETFLRSIFKEVDSREVA